MFNKQEALKIQGEMRRILSEKIIPFWLARSVDSEYGGFLTSYDENGAPLGSDDKYLVTQCRMVWGFSNLQKHARVQDAAAMKEAAAQGLAFLYDNFWDAEDGGFYWQTARDGTPKDRAKLVYGESFAIYALSEYALVYGDEKALGYAERLFDLLLSRAADTLRGGFFENLERDWRPSPAGAYAGDRKSLDIHMHLMEAFTTLYEAGRKEIHRRRLDEVAGLILGHMVNHQHGYGYNQFDLSFNRLPAININRTWNAERETNETLAKPADTTSYGHNVELSWLLSRARKVLGLDEKTDIAAALLDHSLRHGYDYEFGGVYRDGIGDGEALVTDKEWWQNFEALAGYAHGYRLFKDDEYYGAFAGTWAFVRDKFLNLEAGESRQLLNRRGDTIIGNLGNPWKGIYHTGRALAESICALQDI